MNNYKLEYWIESVRDTMEEVGCELSTEAITSIAENMIITAEQEGMAFGYDAIPNPLQTEIDRVKDQLRQERDRCDSREYEMRGELKEERRSWAIRESKYIQIIEDQEDINNART